MSTQGQTLVSLQQHLHTSLAPLLNLKALLYPLHTELSTFVKPSFLESSEEIPDASLGLVTSPSAVLGPYKPPQSAQELRRNAAGDRRAIVALVNAMFSVIGVGVAVWRASSTTGWTHGVRVLWSLFAGFVIAFAEGGLYYIWSQRSSAKKVLPRAPDAGATKKVKPPVVSLEIPSQTTNTYDQKVKDTNELPNGLRRRTVFL